jgi:hypothetical protein
LLLPRLRAKVAQWKAHPEAAMTPAKIRIHDHSDDACQPFGGLKCPTTPAVGSTWTSSTDLDRALSAYAKRHRSELAGHQFLIADFSTGRPFNFLELLTFSAAARDPICADTFAALGGRCIGVSRFLRPDALARAIWVNARYAFTASQMQPSRQF